MKCLVLAFAMFEGSQQISYSWSLINATSPITGKNNQMPGFEFHGTLYVCAKSLYPERGRA